MRVSNHHRSMWKKKRKKQYKFNTTNMADRRGDLSSPVVLCNQSDLENQARGQSKSENATRAGEKVTPVIVYHVT